MKRDFILVDRHLAELNPLIFGEEACESGHSFGPAIRKYTLIHYVCQGKGILYKGGHAYPVHTGEMFIILPDEVTKYVADESDPWVYRWIGFDGALSRKFAELPPVVAVSDVYFQSVGSVLALGGVVEYILAGRLFGLLSELLSGVKRHNHYVRKVQDYIKNSYMHEIRVEQIAESLSLDRRYLTRLFKEKTGKTIQEYLISVRMEEARRLLTEGYGVAEAALLCGYPDACNFSKMFKRIYSVSPARWKKG
ncbi:MAG: AraC family transcriptional regulator [Clostridia bacterium]|nr:AraC family transcriptional regulator [Clostridia bacterium]